MKLTLRILVTTWCIFLLGCFANASWNIKAWPSDSRAMVSVIMGIGAFICFLREAIKDHEYPIDKDDDEDLID